MIEFANYLPFFTAHNAEMRSARAANFSFAESMKRVSNQNHSRLEEFTLALTARPTLTLRSFLLSL